MLDLITPWSQSQSSISQKSFISSFSFFLKIKSITKPNTKPHKNLVTSILIINTTETLWLINIGNISSEVDKYTDINVPNVITLVI